MKFKDVVPFVTGKCIQLGQSNHDEKQPSLCLGCFLKPLREVVCNKIRK
jgi:hypothetical protein